MASIYSKTEIQKLSEVNKFSISGYFIEETHPAEAILDDIVESILFYTSGHYERSSSTCSLDTTSRDKKNEMKILCSTSKISEIKISKLDNRLQYWKKYLENKRKMENKIMRKTGKKRCDVLLNATTEHRKIELVKRIMDYAERLHPENLLTRRAQPYELKPSDPCDPKAASLFESLPATERLGVPLLSIIDTPKSLLKEQHIKECKLKESSWLKSNYLAKRLFCKADDIRRVVEYFPDIDNLSVLKNISQAEKKDLIFTEQKQSYESKELNSHLFTVTEVETDEKEESYEYSVKINEHLITSREKEKRNIRFDICCEVPQYERAHTNMLTLKNCGWKTINFSWEHVPESNLNIFTNKLPPAFYFDKNDIRLIPGQNCNMRMIFCCKTPGIYSERWRLVSEPSFFEPGYSFEVKLFGYCKEMLYKEIKLFNINDYITTKAHKNIVTSVLNSVTKEIPTLESAPKAPYIRFFTEKEIFSNLYPDINCNEKNIEDLKQLYTEANIATKCKCCKDWNFNLEELKNQILDIDDENIRKRLYFQFVNIVKEMKYSQTVTKLQYDDQKFLLVKSVLIAIFDKIDDIAEQLRQLIVKTNLPLEFNEVLVMNREETLSEHTLESLTTSSSTEETISNFSILNLKNIEEKLKKLPASLTKLESQKSIDSIMSATVVKSDVVRKKQMQIYMDSLYMQIFAHLGYAAEEIVGVIEGSKNLF